MKDNRNWNMNLRGSNNREKKQKIKSPKQVVAKPPHAVSMNCCSPQQIPTNYHQYNPTGAISQLEMKPKIKHSKLLSSKSLSQLMPRSLFFKTKKAPTSIESSGELKLATTKSLPNYPNPSEQALSPNLMDVEPTYANRINSVSLLGLPRQSSSNSFGYCCVEQNFTIDRANVSPIVGKEQVKGTIDGPSYVSTPSDSQGENISKHEEKDKQANEKKKPSSRYRPFKSTTLVLRDVKNSIGLRMRAKHDSQAFSKLTNELATPPSKLYSPFNIYFDSQSKDSNRRNRNKADCESDQISDCSMQVDESFKEEDEDRTPKRRIALQHKKHLLHANKFNFDSPTGKFRETVQDVERFQQCIEDISKAIKTRDRSGR